MAAAAPVTGGVAVAVLAGAGTAAGVVLVIGAIVLGVALTRRSYAEALQRRARAGAVLSSAAPSDPVAGLYGDLAHALAAREARSPPLSSARPQVTLEVHASAPAEERRDAGAGATVQEPMVHTENPLQFSPMTARRH